MSTPIYSLRVPEVFEALETSPNGLSSAEAEARLSLYGRNILTKQKKEPVWEKIAEGARRVRARAMKGLNEQEFETLKRLLGQVHQNLEPLTAPVETLT